MALAAMPFQSHANQMQRLQGESGLIEKQLQLIQMETAAAGFGGWWNRPAMIEQYQALLQKGIQMEGAAKTPDERLDARMQQASARSELRKLANPLAQLATTVFGGPAGISEWVKPIVTSVAGGRILGDPQQRKMIVEFNLNNAAAMALTDDQQELFFGTMFDMLRSNDLIRVQG
jgi:hypothetical protein